MFIIKTNDGFVVTIAKIDEDRTVHLGLDTDNLVACFPNRAELDAAMQEKKSGTYQYKHSLAICSRKLMSYTLPKV